MPDRYLDSIQMQSRKSFVRDSSLVLYVPLYNNAGSSFQSSDSYGNPCTVTGATWTSRGRNFDGTDDVINCGNGSYIKGITGKCTFEACIKPTGAGENDIGRILFLNTIDLYILASTQKVTFAITVATVSKGATTANNSVSRGKWYHVVGVYNGTNVLVCTNNTWVTGNATAGPPDAHTTSNFLIGDTAITNRCFNGIIGEARVYNRALTPIEIQRNYLATKWRYI